MSHNDTKGKKYQQRNFHWSLENLRKSTNYSENW